jgi:hypothetical protein
MGWLEGWPFTKKEDAEEKQAAFNDRVFPLGMEAQREAARKILPEIIPPTRMLNETDLLFAYISAKDKYIAANKGGAGVEAVKKHLKSIHWKNENNNRVLLTFIRLESEIGSFDDYPTAEEILAEAEHSV